MLTAIKKALGLTTGDDVIGSVVEFAGHWVPDGYADCSGRLLQINNRYYTPLFSVIGTMYGGDGVSTFALPDLRPTDKNGRRLDWAEAGVPIKLIRLVGVYPQRP